MINEMFGLLTYVNLSRNVRVEVSTAYLGWDPESPTKYGTTITVADDDSSPYYFEKDYDTEEEATEGHAKILKDLADVHSEFFKNLFFQIVLDGLPSMRSELIRKDVL